MNITAVLIASIIPMIIGFIWYNPKVFGKSWAEAAGLSEEKMKNANMTLIFSFTFVLSFMLAMIMQSLVIHQIHVGSMLFNQPFEDPSTEIGALYKKLMDMHGMSYRTFKHGALHGTIAGLFIATPILAINALFERKSFKYIAINIGYWVISMALMGGIISAMV
jgi:hypothetical protein